MSPSSRTTLHASHVVAQTPVVNDTNRLTVSTIRISRNRYETVVFDDHADKRHSGMRLAGFVIDDSQKRASSRDEAMENHREALYAARTETPKGGAR